MRPWLAQPELLALVCLPARPPAQPPTQPRPAPQVLTVVDVSMSNTDSCVHVFPAVLALARNFKGFASFARLMGDEGPETKALLKELRVVEVPTFLFFR
jgi:hypothetical protein